MEWLKRIFHKSPSQPQATPAAGSFGAAFTETLAKGVGQIMEGGTFESVSTKSPEEAVSALFDRALPATPSLSTAAIKFNYQKLKGSWSSQKLFKGSRDKVRSIVLANLHRISTQPGFRNFGVSVELRDCSARIYASVSPYAIPISVWRSEDVYFVCGNSDFLG